jgi:hypothetical protein
VQTKHDLPFYPSALGQGSRMLGVKVSNRLGGPVNMMDDSRPSK